MQLRPLKVYTRQFGFSLAILPRTIAFIREQKIWKGMLSYGWVARIFIVMALLGGLKFLSIFINWVQRLFQSDSAGTALASMGVMAKDMARGSYDLLFSTSSKYIMLVLLEVVVFHFARRTLEILTGKESKAEWRDFVDAQIRMIKVAFRSWILELIVVTMLSVFFSIFGFISFLKPVLVLAVQCYFLGFAVVDNYNEQYGLSIKESVAYSWQYLGVVMSLGLFFSVMLLIPLVGTVAGPCIAAVAVCIIMYKLSDLHTMKEKPAVDLEEMV
ncbi:MAG: EI24 domain-containing protein [Saprospiraceae bacterium]